MLLKIWPLLEARPGFPNPQPNPQILMSCATWRYFGSPRGLVSCCKTNPRYAVTAEVASSSLVVPAILFSKLRSFCNFLFAQSLHRSNPHQKIVVRVETSAEGSHLGYARARFGDETDVGRSC
jgi:hypothetical protein